MHSKRYFHLILFCLIFIGLSSVSVHAACIDNDADGYGNPGDVSCPKGIKTDCNDNNNKVYPGAAEICDGVDTNCDGWKSATDIDKDGDGVPMCKNDCNDNNNTVYPKAPELCDGIDNNCDYSIPMNERDLDADGYRTCGVPADCNDNDRYINPGVQEWCSDTKDNNCNSQVDETPCICPDADSDGFTASYCGGTDCDDTADTVYPGAPELCTDGKDNDCNGLKDCSDPNAVNCPQITDADGDGYDIAGICGTPDCDDNDANVHPGAAEICDGKDSNCDGWKAPTDKDVDGDGVPACGGDCNDNNANINPLILERHNGDPLCGDGIDNDCDGRADALDSGCTAANCTTKTSPKDSPHFFTLLNPDDTVHAQNNALSCGKCHAADFGDDIRFACQRCHADPADTSDPLNGTLKTQYPLAPPYGYGSAPNVAMHSSTVAGAKYGSWTMGDKGCVTCHNPHAQEQNNVFGTDYGMFIKEYVCFNNPVTGLNIQEYVEFTSATDQGSFADGPRNNENICEMCHTRTTVHRRDGSAATHYDGEKCTDCHSHTGGFKASCTSCHGNPPVDSGTLVAIPSPTGSTTAGAHDKHVSTVGLDCAACHADSVGLGPMHRSGAVTLGFSQSGGFPIGGTYDGQASVQYENSLPQTTVTATGTKTCSNIYCHSTVQTSTGGALTGLAGEYRTPVWDGGPMTCASCHGNPPATGSHGKHAGTYSFSCEQCHSGHVPPADTHVDTSINVLVNASWSGAYNGDSTPGNGFSDCSNTYCHSNGTSVATGEIPANSSPVWGSPLGCDGCHSYPPDYPSDSPKKNTHQSHTAQTCNKCHNETTSDGINITTPGNHANKVYNVAAGSGVSFTFTPDAGGGSCDSISCHSYTSSSWGGTAACLDCHSGSQGARAAITSQFSSNSHHIQGVALTNTHCYQCHWEANSDGSINRNYHSGSAAPGAAVDLVIYGTGARPGAYTAGTTAVQYTANGSRTEIQKINAHCIGCHSSPNNAVSPFGDGKTPTQYAYDIGSIDARYSQTGGTAWGKYSGANVTPKNTRTKAYSAHGNAVNNQGGWDLTETWPNKRTGTVNVACFDCHNSHGSNVSGTTTSYTSSTVSGGILKDTTQNKGGYSITYRPQAGGVPENKNAYNAGAGLCFDCHMNAEAASTPWGYQQTFGAEQSIMGYWDSPYFGPGDFASQSRYAYKAATTSQGGHFGASSGLSTSPINSIGGLCTPCHDPHGVSPSLGADMQYAVPLLKGTWMTSPYKEDVAPAINDIYTYRNGQAQYHIDQNTFSTDILASVAPIAQTDNQFAGLCLGCHSKNDLTNGVSGGVWKSVDRIHESVKGWGTNVKHNYSCSKCHVPHNSRLPRLMATNCLNTTHKGQARFASAATAGAYCGEGGCGSGRIPGSYYGSGWEFFEDHTSACHENQTGNGADQSWNTVTAWSPDEPQAPTLTNEPNTGCSSSCAVTLQWSGTPVPDGHPAEYLVEVDDSADFSSPVYASAWIPGTSITTAALNTDTTYYWRVQERDTVHTTYLSAWSVPDAFILTTPASPEAPTLTAEPDYGCVSTCAVTLLWGVVPSSDGDALEYRVQVDDSSDFNSPEYTSAWISGTSATTTALSTGTTYYWRAQARDAVHTSYESAWATADAFDLTTVSAPPAPALIDEPNAGCASSCGVILQWNAVTAPDGHTAQYMFQVDDASNFSSPNYTSAWTTGTSYWSSALSTNTTYYWRVKARDSNPDHITAESGWSGADSFRLVKPPAAPALVDEPNIGCASSCAVTLEWGSAVSGDGDTVQYFVQVDDASDFSSPVYTATWISGNSAATPALSTNTAYYWRVKARDANPDHTVAESAWSNDTFQLTISNSPPAPAIISHGNYDSGCADTAVTVQWDPVTDPDGDPVQYFVSTDSYGDSGWLPAGQTSWSFTNYAGWGVTWKVKARDAAHTGSESPWSSSEFFYDIGSECWSGSCPLIFGWDGNEYKYVTDIQGPVIGLPATALKKSTVLYQPSYIVMDGLVPHTDNNYWIKIRESLPEITYLDETKLLAVDYPKGHQIVTSSAENTYNYGYVNPFTIYTIKSPALPVSATDRDGNDILSSVLAVDNNPAPVTANPPSPDFYTLDFGVVQNPANAKLLIDSWAFYGDSKFTANSTTQPSIEVLDQNGNWVKVKSFGTPAGDLKTMVISIPDIFLGEDHRIRVNMGLRKGSRWMIDRIRLDDSVPAAVTVREIGASAADLQMGGMAVQSMATLFSRIIASDVSGPLSPEALGYGKFTKYGEVGELLAAADDKYVIIRHGDKIDLAFPSPGPVQPGFTRGFILKGNLYYKTFGVANTVEPLPFHGMSDYPYPEGEAYPADEDHMQYLQIYNIREFTQ